MNHQAPKINSMSDEEDSLNFSLAEVIMALSEAVIVVSDNLTVVNANKTATDLFSANGESLKGMRLSEVTRDIVIHKSFKKALKNKNPTPSDVKFSIGNDRSFDVNIAPLHTADYKAAIGVFAETTRIEQLEKVRQEFLSNISHELRTPLTSIVAFVETLESGAIDDEKNNRRFLSTIRRNAARMQHLINDISELASIETGKSSIEISEVNLYSVVSGLLDGFQKKGSEIGVVFENLVPQDMQVKADPFRLEQILVNLIDNAVKFNKENGWVQIRAHQFENETAIEVEDSGEGIPADQLARIFERLYRVDRSRTQEIRGTGLGLSIVKHLTLLHGGEINVESTIGTGSLFTLRLPNQ